MQDIATKSEGSQLTAEEFNQIPSELENTITSTGQTLSSSDVRQLVKAVAIYAAKGDFYTTSGSANAITLNPVGNMQKPIAYSTGLRIRFMPTLSNTNIVTIRINGLPSVSLYNNEGNNLASGELVANQFYTATFDGNNFKISETPMAWVRQVINTKLDKVTTETTSAQLYGKNAAGAQEMRDIGKDVATANTIVLRTTTGTVRTATPTNNNDAVNLSYINNKFQTAESVPSTFTEGVWLAVFEKQGE